VIHRTAVVALGVIWRLLFSRDTSVFSAIEMLHDIALYRLTIGIDTDIDIHTYTHSQSSSARVSCVVQKITKHYKCCENQKKITSIVSAVFACCRANQCVQQRPGHTVKTIYTHGRLIESPFVPSSTERWAVRTKVRQKRPSRCKLCSEKVVEASKREAERWKLWLV